jgi:hypothetical protein
MPYKEGGINGSGPDTLLKRNRVCISIPILYLITKKSVYAWQVTGIYLSLKKQFVGKIGIKERVA